MRLSSTYRPEIDGLRAIAIIPVVLYHAGLSLFSGGYVGVDVFFVISGYLITSIIVTEKNSGTFTLVKFYERRARRILPALYFVLFISTCFSWLWFLPEELKNYSLGISSVSVFLSNVWLYRASGGYFAAASELNPLIHTWSLALEEQYYLLFPVFVTLTWKYGKNFILWSLVLLAILSLGFAHWGSATHPVFNFFLLPSRAWELLAGSIVALYQSELSHGKMQKPISKPFNHQEILSFAGLFLILYAVIYFDKNTPFPSLHTLVPILGTVAIILFASPKTVVGKILSHRWLVATGLISYSIYLIHLPLYAFARHRSLDEPGKPMMIALAILSIALAFLCWKYIETPFRKRNNSSISRVRIFAFSVIGAGVFLIFGLTGYINGGYPSRMNDERVQKLIAAANERNPRECECNSCDEKYKEIKSPETSCLLGSQKSVIGYLLGDSHAGALSHTLDQELDRAGFGIRQLTYGGCAPVRGLYRVDDPEMKCNEYSNEAFRYVSSNRHEYIILAARWSQYLVGDRFDNEEGGYEGGLPVLMDSTNGEIRERHNEKERLKIVIDSYIKSIHSYLEMNKKVILIYPIPEVGWDTPNYLAKNLFKKSNSIENLSTSHDVYKARNKFVIAAFDSIPDHKNLKRVKPENIFCNTFVKDRCVAQIGPDPLYFDDDHLNSKGAALVVSEIMKHLND